MVSVTVTIFKITTKHLKLSTCPTNHIGQVKKIIRYDKWKNHIGQVKKYHIGQVEKNKIGQL